MNITIASMSPNGTICDRVRQAAIDAAVVVLQTARAAEIDGGFEYQTLDDIYDAAEDFDALVQNACDFLMRDNLLFIVLGDIYPNRIAAALVRSTLDAHGQVDVIPGGDPAL